MSVRSVPRYPEVREDGSMWVPVAPPPAPRYRQLSPEDPAIVGMRAVLSYSTEWIVDLRVLTDPYVRQPGESRWVDLCDEGAWHDFDRHGVEPNSDERLVASVSLVFVLEAGEDSCTIR